MSGTRRPRRRRLHVGPQIRRLRGTRSLRDLAREIRCTPSMLMYIEQGERTPSLKMLERIAAALDVPVSKLLGEKGGRT